ncbi:hypothetical protein [Nocardia pseudovaccinii]|uniref:hypothetical protein n=1 Tax=Nocardia pseudovaccinii TaxID=189540 RepID=UPI0035A21E9C
METKIIAVGFDIQVPGHAGAEKKSGIDVDPNPSRFGRDQPYRIVRSPVLGVIEMLVGSEELDRLRDLDTVDGRQKRAEEHGPYRRNNVRPQQGLANHSGRSRQRTHQVEHVISSVGTSDIQLFYGSRSLLGRVTRNALERIVIGRFCEWDLARWRHRRTTITGQCTSITVAATRIQPPIGCDCLALVTCVLGFGRAP